MSIKIHSIPLDKEAWENIPSLVFKSFNAFSTNMMNIKKWADKHEDKLKSEHERRKEACGGAGVAGVHQGARCLPRRLHGESHVPRRGREGRPCLTPGTCGGLPGSSLDVLIEAPAKSSQLSPLCRRRRTQLESRTDATEAALQAMQGRLQELMEEVQAIADGHRREAEDFGCCLAQSLRTSGGLLQHLGAAFEGIGPAEAGPPARPAAGAADGQGLPVPAGQRLPGRDVGEEEEGEADAADGEARAQVEARAEAAAASAGGQGLAEAWDGRSAAELKVAADGLEAQLEGLRAIFGQWGQRRQAEQLQHAAMQATVDDLRFAAERTRDRLLSWREMLKESSHAIDALRHSVAGTQSAVRQLQDTQVRKRDVDEAVSTSAEQLQELNDATERRMGALAERLAQHEADMEQLLMEARTETDDLIGEHSQQVAQMVERNINPINAYLNTMHVKADAVRMELDALSDQVPRLAAQIGEVAAELQQSDEAGRGRAAGLASRLDTVVATVVELGERGTAQHGEFSGALGSLQQELGQKLSALRESLLATTENLDGLRAGDVAGLSHNLNSLEQKVAKWVHAHPLPAKVSEARLYSLEARLADETEARLKIEQEVGMRGGRMAYPPRAADTSLLPQLPQLPLQPAWEGGAAGRSPLDAYRQHSARKAPKVAG